MGPPKKKNQEKCKNATESRGRGYSVLASVIVTFKLLSLMLTLISSFPSSTSPSNLHIMIMISA